jgi:ribosomal protein S18 acetylase RimI-like enzyme
MPPTSAIRVLDTVDAARFQDLRLDALQESPTAFASSYSQEADTPLTETALRLKPDQDWSWVLGGFIGSEELVGMVGFRRERGPKHTHKAVLWGMYVRPSHRGNGIGRSLIGAFLVRAGAIDGLEQIKLTVNPTQEAAVHLYSSLGFQSYGREPCALKIGGRYFDEDYMILRLHTAA